jgi:hypothetical protein
MKSGRGGRTSVPRKVDTTQPGFVVILRAAGFFVEPRLAQLGKGAPDILCRSPRGDWHVIEAKTGNKKLTPDEQYWHLKAGGVPVIGSDEELLAWIQGALK